MYEEVGIEEKNIKPSQNLNVKIQDTILKPMYSVQLPINGEPNWFSSYQDNNLHTTNS